MLTKNIELNNKTILVTGAAGFIGASLVEGIFEKYENVCIVGIDNMNDYYDVTLKKYRIDRMDKMDYKVQCNRWIFMQGDIADKSFVESIFKKYKPEVVVNMAAQAGVRHSIDNPDIYIESNIIGFYNILEACRHSYDECSNHKTEYEDDKGENIENNRDIYGGVEHLVYASSSSIYGNNTCVPYSTKDKADSPISLYAATKKSNELMAHAYAKLYNIPCTGLRFFTVYGPAGRPDMAYFDFTKSLIEGKKIRIFNYGNCKRDFTYIDDIVEGVIRVMEIAPIKENGNDGLPIPPFRLYNIGNSKPESMLDFIRILSDELVKEGLLDDGFNLDEHMELVAMQPGDVIETYADISELERDTGFKPSVDIKEGICNFVKWYKKYIKDKNTIFYRKKTKNEL